MPNQCTGLCTTCDSGYDNVDGVCVGATLRLSGFSVKVNQDIAQSPEPAGLYVTSDLKVGISTGNPQYMLHIATGAGETGTIMAVSTGTTNVFWVAGDGAHAIKFFGDVSGATGFPSGDNLGDHTATKDLSMGVYQITGSNALTMSSVMATSALGVSAYRLWMNPNVEISSTTAAYYGGVYASTHVFVSGDVHATKFYGDVSDTTGLPSGDNLGNHIATKALDMAAFGIINVASVSAAGPMTASSFTATGIEGLGAAQLRLADNVLISSEAGADLGAGIRISTNVYVVGFSSAAKYYGDGSNLTNVIGDDLGDHTATKDLDMATFDIANVSTITVSTIAISGAGLGIAITSHVFVNGDVHATYIYGDVSGATGLPSGDNLGDHIATKALDMNSFAITGAANIDATGFTEGAGNILSNDILGNAATVTAGVYTTGSYADPSWITSLVGTKIGSGVPAANIADGSLGANVMASSVALAGFYSANAVRTNLGLAIGTNVQAWDT
ncbi:MAG: hypothetical protein L6420_01855, partial [Elusimicrobia bacterium]|nr:hypothetical protein [Elusimicrobiota bacterium]